MRVGVSGQGSCMDGSADGNGHGSQVAGIIDAVQGNCIGVAGLAAGVHIPQVGGQSPGWAVVGMAAALECCRV